MVKLLVNLLRAFVEYVQEIIELDNEIPMDEDL